VGVAGVLNAKLITPGSWSQTRGGLYWQYVRITAGKLLSRRMAVQAAVKGDGSMVVVAHFVTWAIVPTCHFDTRRKKTERLSNKYKKIPTNFSKTFPLVCSVRALNSSHRSRPFAGGCYSG
jgi:hypothetical protein